jgi:signal transduction histidine kinase
MEQISHELRSPLHGVLAACEFLSETTLTNYQKNLIETQVSCGKTLLQVIEQVLDYSKINSFEKVSLQLSSPGLSLWCNTVRPSC